MTESSSLTCVAVLLAAGLGQRFGAPKSFQVLGGRPLLSWSIEVLDASRVVESIVVVTRAEDCEQAQTCLQSTTTPSAVIRGGATRQDSLSLALSWIEKKAEQHYEFVLVHDGARPFISQEIISRLVKGLQNGEHHDAVLPVLPAVDSLAELEGSILKSTSHERHLWRIQTPQLYRHASLRNALREEKNQCAVKSDVKNDVTWNKLAEWSKIQAQQGSILCIDGDEDLIKVTHQSDLATLEKRHQRLHAQSTTDSTRQVRTTMGYDLHRKQADRPLWLAGVKIRDHDGLVGHSDADIVLHALCDAIYAGLGVGDIGQFFPDHELENKDASSKIFVQHAVSLLNKADATIDYVDCTIVSQEPKLAPHHERMRRRLAQLLQVPETLIAMKAKTNEGVDSLGEGKSMAAWVLVTLSFPTLRVR